MITGQSYGDGELLMWEKKVNVAKIKYSRKVLSIMEIKTEEVALSDVILWDKFNIRYLGQKPKSGLNSKISWKGILTYDH